MNAVARITLLLALASAAIPSGASAGVRKEGTWPASEKEVSFEFDGKPSDGLNKLASEAGWSLVVSKSIAIDEHDVHIDVDDQPADRVLEALFAESKVLARRNGALVTMTRDDAPPAAAPATPIAPPIATASDAPAAGAPPVPAERGEDRSVMGGSLVVEKGEIFHTVKVTGGSAKIRGTVTGDLIVAGGSARIEPGARVIGNVTVFGGSVRVANGGRIDGDVGVAGGVLKREEGAIVGGKVVSNAEAGGAAGIIGVEKGDLSKRSARRSAIAEKAHAVGNAITNYALLFVFGCVLLALSTGRMDRLRVEVAGKPMRSFAMGVLGSVGAFVALFVLCITLVGLPFALLALLIGIFAIYGSMAAVLTTFGEAIIGHKTKNTYFHLLFGCAALLLVSAIPYLGGFVTFVVTMLAIGALVSTRLAGFVDRRAKPGLV